MAPRMLQMQLNRYYRSLKIRNEIALMINRIIQLCIKYLFCFDRGIINTRTLLIEVLITLIVKVYIVRMF